MPLKNNVFEFDTNQKPKLNEVGGKGLSLILSKKKGFSVPNGFVLCAGFFEKWVKEVEEMNEWRNAVNELNPSNKSNFNIVKKKALNFKFSNEQKRIIKENFRKLNGNIFAVRSSSPEEDLEGASFAGGYETILGVTEKTLFTAIKKSFISCLDERIYLYKKEHGFNVAKPRIAVIIQEQIASEVSGVGFSVNPLNNSQNELVINSNFGLGETVVSGEVTPDTFILNKKENKIIKKIIGSKSHAILLNENGGTKKQQLDNPNQESLSKKQILEIAKLIKEVERFYEKPMDIEWAYYNEKLYLLQARPITASGPDWTVPYKDFFYARASIVELLPDPLSPLFSTLAGPAISKTIVELVVELMPEVIKLMNAKTVKFVDLNGYGYYAMKFSNRELISVTIKMLPLYSKLIRGLTLRIWKEEKRPNYVKNIEKWKKIYTKELSAKKLLRGADELTYSTVAHYTAIQAILPVIYMSESIMTTYYDKLIKRKNDPPAQNFVMGYDSVPINADKSLYDIALWTKSKSKLKQYLLKNKTEKILDHFFKASIPRGVDSNEWNEWQEKFTKHLESFGHVIYDLDFMKAVPFDHPDPLLETLKFYLQGKGNNPYERQKTLVKQRKRDVKKIINRVGPIRRWGFKKLLKLAQDYAPIREDSLADVALAYPLVRQMLFELGKRLKQVNAIRNVEDIFWLNRDELVEVAGKLDKKKEIRSFVKEVKERRALWDQQRKLTPPVMLPEDYKLFGMDMSAFLPQTKQEGEHIKGIGASRGKIKGTARVILGPEDFDKMRPGDILVTAITTPAWTPLFAMASGIVTDVGGPLSHSSIVAREYGIPAVLGTGVASKRIKSGQIITVDGDNGMVYIN